MVRVRGRAILSVGVPEVCAGGLVTLGGAAIRTLPLATPLTGGPRRCPATAETPSTSAVTTPDRIALSDTATARATARSFIALIHRQSRRRA